MSDVSEVRTGKLMLRFLREKSHIELLRQKIKKLFKTISVMQVRSRLQIHLYN
jgi:hypothetical protein